MENEFIEAGEEYLNEWTDYDTHVILKEGTIENFQTLEAPSLVRAGEILGAAISKNESEELKIFLESIQNGYDTARDHDSITPTDEDVLSVPDSEFI